MRSTIIICSVLASISVAYASEDQGGLPPGSSLTDEYTFEPELFRGGRFSQTALAALAKKIMSRPGNIKLLYMLTVNLLMTLMLNL